MIEKAIVMGGGLATRLWPSTAGITKQLLPVYDKPMIFYPLSTVIATGCNDIGLVCSPRDWPAYKKTLEVLEAIGVRFTMLEQDEPRGIAQAYQIARPWLDGKPSYLILGDNIFIGNQSFNVRSGYRDVPSIWIKSVENPNRFGVLTFDHGVPRLIEKPTVDVGNDAVTGIYAFPGDASERAAVLTPSHRGQLEIVDLIMSWDNAIDIHRISGEVIWTDAGTCKSLNDISNAVHLSQSLTGMVVGSPELAAVSSGMATIDRVYDVVCKYTKDHGLLEGYYPSLLTQLRKA